MLTSMTYQEVTGRPNKFTSIYTLKKKQPERILAQIKKKLPCLLPQTKGSPAEPPH